MEPPVRMNALWRIWTRFWPRTKGVVDDRTGAEVRPALPQRPGEVLRRLVRRLGHGQEPVRGNVSESHRRSPARPECALLDLEGRRRVRKDDPGAGCRTDPGRHPDESCHAA